MLKDNQIIAFSITQNNKLYLSTQQILEIYKPIEIGFLLPLLLLISNKFGQTVIYIYKIWKNGKNDVLHV